MRFTYCNNNMRMKSKFYDMRQRIILSKVFFLILKGVCATQIIFVFKLFVSHEILKREKNHTTPKNIQHNFVQQSQFILIQLWHLLRCTHATILDTIESTISRFRSSKCHKQFVIYYLHQQS